MIGRRLASRCAQDLPGPVLDALDAALATAIEEARTRWPELAGPPADARSDARTDARADALIDALASRVEGEEDLARAVTRLALPDLFLVVAVLEGDRGALAVFERLVRSETTRVVARLGTGAPAVEDVVQELLLKLLVPAGDATAKLVAYGGHGALHAWLRVAAVRTAISMTRRRRESLVEDDALAAVADGADDQALAFLKHSYRADFKRAFEATLAELPRRARTLLRLQIIDHLTLEEIGAFYQVSRATTARWLADARAQLVAGTQTRLVAALAIDADELAELMRLVASTLYSTLPGLLRRTATPAQPAS